MNKKKASICTLLLTVVWFGALIGSWFVKTSDGIFRLSYVFIFWMALWFMADSLSKFRSWLMKGE